MAQPVIRLARFAVLAFATSSLLACGSSEVKQTPEEVSSMMERNSHKRMGPAAGAAPVGAAPAAPQDKSAGAQ